MEKSKKKVGAIIYTIDPEGCKRFLLRHNKPFNGYQDEWTISFGGIEKNETPRVAAAREASEEFGIKINPTDLTDLGYKITYDESNIKVEIIFWAVQLKSIDEIITLNEESIGYDWAKLETVLSLMQHDDEKKAVKLADQLS